MGILGTAENLVRKIKVSRLRSLRKECFNAYREVGCDSVMPKTVFGKVHDISFVMSNANVKLPTPGLFSRAKSITHLAAHEGTHARQYSDNVRYFVAKEGGDAQKGLASFKNFMKEKGYAIADDSFYKASIQRRPPMQVGSKEWQKTEFMMKSIDDYNSFDPVGGLKTPYEVEANLNTAKKSGIPFETLYKRFINKYGGMKPEQAVPFWNEVNQVIDKLA